MRRHEWMRGLVGCALVMAVGCGSSHGAGDGGPTPTACTTNADCAGGELCVGGQCLEACGAADPCTDDTLVCSPATNLCVECATSSDCGADERCEAERCVAACGSDADCAGGERCDVTSGVCVSLGCGSDADCPGGERCEVATGSCEVICALASDCAPGELCLAGMCLEETTAECTGSAECDGLEQCVGGLCRCPAEFRCGDECVDPATDGFHCGACGNECDLAAVCEAGACCAPAENLVDLLFVVDGSNSMLEEQVSLADQLPRLVRILTSGDADLDGTPDFPPVTDLRAGVVTVDMGSGAVAVPTCDGGPTGDDGILSTRGNTDIAGCAGTYPRFLDFAGDAVDFSRDLSCVARVGTGGCGFEQQLEAGLKALTPSTSDLTFVSGSGHGDGANEGFLRDEAILGVILLTDEDDCSTTDTELFDPSSVRYGGVLNLRCFQFQEALHPVSRYVDGLQALKRDRRRVVFSAIVGVPPDLVPEPGDVDFDRVLDDPRMAEVLDPSMPTRLAPSCNVPGRGLAFPPRRIVQVARDLRASGSGAVLSSICQDDFTRAFDAIIPRLADASTGPVCR